MKSGYLISVATPEEVQCVCLAFLLFLDDNDMSICNTEMTEWAREILLRELEKLGPEKTAKLGFQLSKILNAALFAEASGEKMKTVRDQAQLN
jgi:hypothetical protein